MIAPPPLPKLQRDIDAHGAEMMTGEQALDNIAMLYGAYGDVRATLIALQAVVRVAGKNEVE
jgi:hypothetical protein